MRPLTLHPCRRRWLTRLAQPLARHQRHDGTRPIHGVARPPMGKWQLAGCSSPLSREAGGGRGRRLRGLHSGEHADEVRMLVVQQRRAQANRWTLAGGGAGRVAGATQAGASPVGLLGLCISYTNCTLLHFSLTIYMYVYIYMYVCMCVYMYVCM
jgi:hypothetical protein